MHKKRIAIIIGGTSDIGYAIIERLIRKYEIIFSYNKNYKKARSMKNYFAHHISFFKLDINSKKEIISFVKKIEKFSDRVDKVIFNSSMLDKRSNFMDIKYNTVKLMINVNCLGLFFLTQKLVSIFKNKKIIRNLLFISSKASKTGGYQLSHYSATKSFMNTFVLSISKELKAYKIICNTIILYKVLTKGFMLTSMNHKKRSKAPIIRSPSEVAKKCETILDIKNLDYSGRDYYLK
jgi:short-subunit dehydrogenase